MKKKKIKYFSFLFLFLGLGITVNIVGQKYILKFKNTKKVQNFFNIIESHNEVDMDINDNYLGILEIPNLHLKRGFYDFQSKNNSIKKNIELLNKSIMPNQSNSQIFLAAHSGNSNIAYFKNLNQLRENDIAYIYYNKKKYHYYLKQHYQMEKNGTMDIKNNLQTSSLYLITCNKYDSSKQEVYVFILIFEEFY